MEDVIVLSSDSDSESSTSSEMEPVEIENNTSETIVPKDNAT